MGLQGSNPALCHHLKLSVVENQSIRSPKRNRSCSEGRASWYSYYAGYSPDFVHDALRFAGSKIDTVRVLDPWNGSGTTTQVVSSAGLSCWGFDLNPAMVIVAKAKSVDRNEHTAIPSLVEQICSEALAVSEISAEDPLRAWLGDGTAATFRSIEKAITCLLVDGQQDICLAELSNLSEISPAASFFYLALFRSLRFLLESFSGSNPTWIKNAESDLDRISVDEEHVFRLFRREVSTMTNTLAAEIRSGYLPEGVPPIIEVANSSSLPVADSHFDVVISSPPYCTRIDYAVKTGPDLAILGANRALMRCLRDRMIGTPTITDGPGATLPEWGSECISLLNEIKTHTAKASSSYYWKTYMQYFRGLFASFRELVRTLRAGGLCFLVVQDSFYKNLHVDLAGITEEMLGNLGLRLTNSFAFDTRRTIAGMNSNSRVYRKRLSSTETVLILERP